MRITVEVLEYYTQKPVPGAKVTMRDGAGASAAELAGTIDAWTSILLGVAAGTSRRRHRNLNVGGTQGADSSQGIGSTPSTPSTPAYNPYQSSFTPAADRSTNLYARRGADIYEQYLQSRGTPTQAQ